MKCTTILFACVALVSTGSARVLPKVKRDNTTCCGYALENRGNTRFRYQHLIDFSTMTSLDQVTRAGWGISNGWQTGGTNPSTGQYAVARESNVKLVPGVGLTLTVPGRQSQTAATFSAAEITFPYIVLGGYFEVEAKVTKVAGTVFSMFTYHGDPWGAPLGWQDQQSIKVLSANLITPTPWNAAGMQVSNADPTTSYTKTVAPFPADPSTAFHKYSISWLPTLTYCPALNQGGLPTKYRYDGNIMNAPVGGYSTHQSQYILSLSTNADPQLSYGPPTTDAVVTIKAIRVWYDIPNKTTNGACPTKNTFDCTVPLTCKVPIAY